MIDAISKVAANTAYDFRKTACPEDPLKHLFEEWVPYYKVKWAIANVLRPRSILEIGVRFGYSAAAFLNGSPNSSYLGIDLDAESFGGAEGAINWAKRILKERTATFLLGNSQNMSRLPGALYDLVHVDGQQDGDGTFHDMQLAIAQGRNILADGYFWSRTNMLALTEFVYQYRREIEFYGVIPGYAGELLIKVRDESLQASTEPTKQSGPPNSLDIQHAYTSSYYLEDCGGYRSFKATCGTELQDGRLLAVASLASQRPFGRILDLGCGRGELAHWFATQGYEVTAIDYSESAIQLAEQCLQRRPDLRSHVNLLAGDVCSIPLSGQYDVALASDLIEHLSPAELERLYARIAKHLRPDGLFVIHTFPNRWFYQYEYARKRRLASRIGSYLSPQPRSRYELLMHINEQSPRTMRQTLKRYFPSVLIWVGDPERPAGSLEGRFSKQQLRAAPDLFAVASFQPISPTQVLARIQSKAVPELEPGQLIIKAGRPNQPIHSNSTFELDVELTNRSGFVLNSFMPYPIRLSYHWLKGKTVTVHNGIRTPLWPILNPGETRTYKQHIGAPPALGPHLLRVTLVQEFIRWFDEPPLFVQADLDVLVSA